MSYPESLNVFPNRPHWDENGVFCEARNKTPICSCPPKTSPAPNLCSQCQKIRLRHVIFCDTNSWRVDLGRLDAMIKRPECDFCSLIVLGCKQHWPRGEPWEDVLLGKTNSTCAIDAVVIDRQRPGGYSMQVTLNHTMMQYQWLDFDIVLKKSEAMLESRERSFELFPRVDFVALRSMFRDCEENHKVHDETEELPSFSELFLIDLKGMRVVAVPARSHRYCTLSYVWGKPTDNWLALNRRNIASLEEENSLLNANIPKTIRDAMQVCLEIGENYLWVDSLCIIQDDPVDQKRQIDAMDSIYKEAEVALVAAAGDNANTGLPGVSSWLRDSKIQTITIQDIQVSNVLPQLKNTVDSSVWNTRGWTYQERMFSKRCICFTEIQAYYACSKEVQYERKGRFQPTFSISERVTNAWGTGLSSEQSLLDTYSQNVMEYTHRTLTSQADILRAFQGVMHHVEGSGAVHYGIPAEHFEDALLWQPALHTELRLASITLPSWTWASVKGPVKYNFKEKRLCSLDSSLPAYWQDNEEPSVLRIHWLHNEDGTHLISVKNGVPESANEYPYKTPPAPLCEFALQKSGRLLFSTQYAQLELQNSVPYTTLTSWWTDYTQDVDQSKITMLSILVPGNGPDDPAGFMEMDKRWAEETFQPQNKHRKWEFIAISLAASRGDDYMHMYLTQLRNINYPLVWSRNVRQLLVNVMLIEWDGGVARRLGVGKVYLDMWEKSGPCMKWVVLE